MFSLSTSSLVLMFSIECGICSFVFERIIAMANGEMNKNRRIYHLVKRMIDIVLSLLGLIVISPFVGIIAIQIKIDSKGPVFFKHHRIGKNGKPFSMYKFRTMKVGAEDMIKDFTPEQMEEWSENFKLKDDPRITRIGKFLRKTSLDELPQIWNILIGDMSIIGPRPALWNQFDLIKARDKYGANNVMPGLTGWAQINGRDELSVDEKAKLDGEYCANIGFIMDCKCFLKSIISVVKCNGVVEGGTGEMDESISLSDVKKRKSEVDDQDSSYSNK